MNGATHVVFHHRRRELSAVSRMKSPGLVGLEVARATRRVDARKSGGRRARAPPVNEPRASRWQRIEPDLLMSTVDLCAGFRILHGMMPCHTAEQTALYERGYPYLVTLVDGHKDDKKPVASVAKAFKNYWGPYHSAWPRLTAAAFARASAVRKDGWDEPEVAKAASATGPVTPDEASQIVGAWFKRGGRDSFNEAQHSLFTLEALVGTDHVLSAVTKGLEGAVGKKFKDDTIGDIALLAYLSGLLLLRSAKAAEHRKGLEAVYEASVKAKLDQGEHSIRGGLDLALHGNEGALRTLAKSHWQYWYYYLMVSDPKIHLTRLADNAKSDWVPEARILFLAGPEMLPIYTSKKALRNGKRMPEFLADFSMFDHDGIVDLMVDMIGVKGAADVPGNYFRENGARVKKTLARIANGGSARAEKAKAALKLLA